MFSRYAAKGISVSTPAERRRANVPPPQLAERVRDRSFVDSAPFLDGGERRSFVRHVIASPPAPERRGHRDRPVEGVDRSDTSYVDAYAEAGYTPMPLDPAQVAQLKTDIAQLDMPRIVDDAAVRLRGSAAAAAPIQSHDTTDADEQRAAHTQIERALRAAEHQTAIFSLDYARDVPDALLDRFLTTKELQPIVNELAPLFVVPELLRPHTTLAYMQRVMGSVGCKFIEAKKRRLTGSVRDYEEERQGKPRQINEHDHYDNENNTTSLLIATFCCMGVYIDLETNPAQNEPADKNAKSSRPLGLFDDDDDNDDDDENSNGDDGMQEEPPPKKNTNNDSQFYRVDLVFHRVDDDDDNDDDVLCFRTFRFHAKR